MGQALQKAIRFLKVSSAPKTSAPEQISQTPAQRSVEIRSNPPDTHPLIKHGENVGDWDRSDPKYSAMVHQVVGRVTTRPGEKQEMGEATVGRYMRAKPVDRHTASRADEDVIVVPGSLNIAHIREIFLLYQGLKEGQEKHLDIKGLAEKYKVDHALLEKVLHFHSLPNKTNDD